MPMRLAVCAEINYPAIAAADGDSERALDRLRAAFTV
jgi:hypothetical protein